MRKIEVGNFEQNFGEFGQNFFSLIFLKKTLSNTPFTWNRPTSAFSMPLSLPEGVSQPGDPCDTTWNIVAMWHHDRPIALIHHDLNKEWIWDLICIIRKSFEIFILFKLKIHYSHNFIFLFSVKHTGKLLSYGSKGFHDKWRETFCIRMK